MTANVQVRSALDCGSSKPGLPTTAGRDYRHGRKRFASRGLVLDNLRALSPPGQANHLQSSHDAPSTNINEEIRKSFEHPLPLPLPAGGRCGIPPKSWGCHRVGRVGE